MMYKKQARHSLVVSRHKAILDKVKTFKLLREMAQAQGQDPTTLGYELTAEDMAILKMGTTDLLPSDSEDQRHIMMFANSSLFLLLIFNVKFY